jgi:integrase
VPVFTSEELYALRRACQGRSFAARRDTAIIEVLLATGIRRSEMAGIRCDPACGDLNLAGREIRVRGKGGRERIVKISYHAARAVDRYLRARAKHPLAARPELWLGTGGRGPVTPDGIYQIVVRAGRKAGVAVYPHRFRHHFSHTWLDRGGDGGDLMELDLPADARVVRRQRPGCPGPPQLRPDHERLTPAVGAPGSCRARQPMREIPASLPACQGRRCRAKLVARMVRTTRGGRS